MEIVELEGSEEYQDSNSSQRISKDKRKIMFEALLKQSVNGKVKHGSIKDLTTFHSVSKRTLSRIWKKGITGIGNGEAADVSLNLLGNVGRKRIQFNPEDVARIPLNRRTTIRSTAAALQMSKTSLHRRVKEGSLKSHSNAIKPFLTEENQKVRLKFCISMLDLNSSPRNPSFIDMYDRVHIDEKWFYLSRTSQKYYLLPDEVEPYRTCKSKRFITKVMFLCAVARPRFDSTRNEMFDGKIGIFPFIYKEAAKRRSKNREVGTIETKSIESVTKEVTRKWLIDHVLPAIRAKCPRSSSKTIYIQQDNAPPHIAINDTEFVEAAQKDDFDIRSTFQPSNSPDMNVLDLGFFRALQSLQYQEASRNVDELIFATQKAFNEISIESLGNVFLTLQLCMIEVMKKLGGNNYKVPHINKQRLEREGILPTTISCDLDVLNGAISWLQ